VWVGFLAMLAEIHPFRFGDPQSHGSDRGRRSVQNSSQNRSLK
jgi:hypothetical protein